MLLQAQRLAVERAVDVAQLVGKPVGLRVVSLPTGPV
jgi:hypothetical protein